jgi:hypothetical protein
MGAGLRFIGEPLELLPLRRAFQGRWSEYTAARAYIPTVSIQQEMTGNDFPRVRTEISSPSGSPPLGPSALNFWPSPFIMSAKFTVSLHL